MTPDQFLTHLQQALEDIVDPVRYLPGREQSYQAALYAALERRLDAAVELDHEHLRLEQEVTKSESKHGFELRPDLILHIPFELGVTASRRVGNLVAGELKVRGTRAEARGDYESLATLCDRLDYQLGFFVNIDSDEPHRDVYDGPHSGRIYGFAVRLVAGLVHVVGPRPASP